MESKWRRGVWLAGLTNFVPHYNYDLATPLLDFPGFWVFNSAPSTLGTRGSLVAPPGVVLPDEYVFLPNLSGGPFPFGYTVDPDH